ncbi:MAG TPA: PASTA domain-containing protein [Candidatus Acidoferrum sp.]|jgi:eukaryotic-like serine/threonine-protein kinase|nr:PASTA domain-containing protein [Candidatus Acidoferrum sp.]
MTTPDDPSSLPETPEITLRERLERVSRMALLVFILASAAFLSAITTMRIAIHGREVTMPNLVGKGVAEANGHVTSLGLVLRVADRVYSDLPMNVVVRQTPPPGMLMKVSQEAHVVLSLGQRNLTIPPLEGKSLRASRIELLRTGLQIGEVSALALPDAAPDTVVIQNPRPGSTAATPRVDVLVVQPPRENAFVMPHLVGLSEAEAQRRLDQSSVHHKENYMAAPQWPRGVVIDQTPVAGARLAASSTVELTVAN